MEPTTSAATVEDYVLDTVAASSVRSELEEALDDTVEFVLRFVHFPASWYARVVALWVAHTWAFDVATQTPYLWIASPEMGSGKTRLLETLEVLVRRPWFVIEPSESVTFRKIDSTTPTMLLDEIDVIFSKDRKGDAQAGLRAIINSGNRRGATVDRAEQFGNNLKSFKVYCPKAFAGIGKLLPPTVVDRSIKIPMERKKKTEFVDRFKRSDIEAEATALRQRLQAAIAGAHDSLTVWREWRPESELLDNDRAAESWEPLFAIAEAAGGEWFDGVRLLAAKVQQARADDMPSGVLLLAHARDAFGTEDRITSSALLGALRDRDDGPWAKWWQAETRAEFMELSRKLDEFGIHSKTIRVADQTPKGYLRRDFVDAWERYLPPVATDVATVADRGDLVATPY